METNAPDDKTLKGLIEKIRIELTEYFETRLKLFKLEASEKTSILGSHLIFGLMVAFVSLLIVIFLLATLAIVISSLTHSVLAGFSIVTGLVVLSLIVLLIRAKTIRLKLTNFILSILADAEKDE